jgi:GNAT superfamily N-acetyltransferase
MSGQALRIRRAVPGEAASLTALAFSSKAHWGYSTEVLRRWSADLTVLPADIEAYPTYVAEAESEVVGFYQLRPAPGCWTLEHLWVRPPGLRQGIGATLLKHALREAQRAGQLRVAVTADPNAAGFYERAGGEKVGTLKAPLPDHPARELPLFEFRSCSF